MTVALSAPIAAALRASPAAAWGRTPYRAVHSGKLQIEQLRQLLRLPQQLSPQERDRLRRVDGAPAAPPAWSGGAARAGPLAAASRRRLATTAPDAADAGRRASPAVLTISGAYVLRVGEAGRIGRCRIDFQPLIQAAHHAYRIGDEPLVDHHRDPVAAEALQVTA